MERLRGKERKSGRPRGRGLLVALALITLPLVSTHEASAATSCPEDKILYTQQCHTFGIDNGNLWHFWYGNADASDIKAEILNTGVKGLTLAKPQVWRNQLHVVYGSTDALGANVVHTWFDQGVGHWQNETFDGATGLKPGSIEGSLTDYLFTGIDSTGALAFFYGLRVPDGRIAARVARDDGSGWSLWTDHFTSNPPPPADPFWIKALNNAVAVAGTGWRSEYAAFGSTKSSVDWCGAFVGYFLSNAGDPTPMSNNPAWVPNWVSAARSSQYGMSIVPASQAPQPGDLFAIDYDGLHRNTDWNHIGFVRRVISGPKKVAAGYQYTVETMEGNTTGRTALIRTRTVTVTNTWFISNTAVFIRNHA